MDYSAMYGFLVSLGVGALIGIERERRQRKRTDIAGVRTFILISLFGTLTALITETHSQYFILASFLGLFMLIGLGYTANVYVSKELGLTTEITALMVFILGYACYYPESRIVAVMIGIVVAVLLALKEDIREFALEVEEEELFDTFKFLVITFIILPLLPNKTLDPLNVVNPYKIWLMVVLISAIGYFGYIMVKILGPDKGIGVTGFLGGLTSSTAVTTAMASKVKSAKGLLRPAAFATVLASTMMFPRVLLEVLVINSNLLEGLAVPMTAMLSIGLISSLVILHKKTDFKAKVDLESPLALKPALKFGAFFIAILIASTLSRTYLGDAGVYLTSAIAGLADVDAITLSMATMTKTGDMPSNVAVNAIVFAAIVNTLMKFVYAKIMGTKEFAKWVGGAVGAIILAGVASLILV